MSSPPPQSRRHTDVVHSRKKLRHRDRRRVHSFRTMGERLAKKLGIKKCRSATFSIDGFSFTIGKTPTFLYALLEIMLPIQWFGKIVKSDCDVTFALFVNA